MLRKSLPQDQVVTYTSGFKPSEVASAGMCGLTSHPLTPRTASPPQPLTPSPTHPPYHSIELFKRAKLPLPHSHTHHPLSLTHFYRAIQACEVDIVYHWNGAIITTRHVLDARNTGLVKYSLVQYSFTVLVKP